MTADDARRSLDRAQALLDQVSADTTRLDEIIAWYEGARARAVALDAYTRELVDADVAAVTAEDATAHTPPVAGEDLAYEALMDRHMRVLAMLRLVTEELTADLEAAPEA